MTTVIAAGYARDVAPAPSHCLYRRSQMTLCPIALAVGCPKCPAFKICPATTILGDQKKDSGKSDDQKKG